MKKLVASIAIAASLAGFAGVASAAEEHDLKAATEHAIEGGHFPILKPKNQEWSFAGPFGKYDKAQLQRGLKVYKEVCSACHSMKLVAFRSLEELGYSDAQVKAFAAEYEVQDGPNGAGDMFTRKAVPSDHFPSPFAKEEAAASANNGAHRRTSRCWQRRAAWSVASRPSSSISSPSIRKAGRTISTRC